MPLAPTASLKARILIIDDDAFISGLYGEVLSRAGYGVTYARNGFAGLKEAAENAYDLILLDVMMPELDGFETLTRLKLDAKSRNIPVIMLTSVSHVDDIDHGMRGGAAAYLTKQKVVPSEAIAEIERVLAMTRETMPKAAVAASGRPPAKKPARRAAKSGRAKKPAAKPAKSRTRAKRS